MKAVASLFMRECARTGSLFLHCFSIQKTPTCAAFFLVSPCRSSVVWLGGRGRPLFRCQLSHIHAKQKGPEPCGPTSPDGAGAVRAPSKPAAAGGGRPRITMAFSKPVGVNPGPSSVEVVEKGQPLQRLASEGVLEVWRRLILAVRRGANLPTMLIFWADGVGRPAL